MFVRSALVRPICLSVGVVVSSLAIHAQQVDFGRDIEPILVKRCSECHGPDKQKGKLRLDLKADALKGGPLAPELPQQQVA